MAVYGTSVYAHWLVARFPLPLPSTTSLRRWPSPPPHRASRVQRRTRRGRRRSSLCPPLPNHPARQLSDFTLTALQRHGRRTWNRKRPYQQPVSDARKLSGNPARANRLAALRTVGSFSGAESVLVIEEFFQCSVRPPSYMHAALDLTRIEPSSSPDICAPVSPSFVQR